MIIDFTVYVSLKFTGEYIFLYRYFSGTDWLNSLHTGTAGLQVAAKKHSTRTSHAYLYLADMFVILVTEGYITVRFPSSKQIYISLTFRFSKVVSVRMMNKTVFSLPLFFSFFLINILG